MIVFFLFIWNALFRDWKIWEISSSFIVLKDWYKPVCGSMQLASVASTFVAKIVHARLANASSMTC